MNRNPNANPFERTTQLDALREQLEEQNAALAEAHAALLACGQTVVTVPREQLEAIDQACLVRISPLHAASALRG